MNQSLYYRSEKAPEPLPLILYDQKNSAFTSPFSDQFLKTLGFYPAPDKPEETETHLPVWKDLHWQMVEKKKIIPVLPFEITEVTSAQAQVALYNAGLLEIVEDKIANHPYPPIRIWFRSARNWRKDNPYVIGMAAELELTDKQFNDLFSAASAVIN